MTTYYKVARPDGWDFSTGRTIDYRAGIGGIVTAPDWRKVAECGQGLHFSAKPLDALRYGSIPCSAYIVEPVGRQRIRIDATKSKAQSLRVVAEVTDLDTLFGFRYSEAVAPVHPFRIERGPVTDEELALLRGWDSVRASVWGSVGGSVGGSVRASVWASVWDSVRGSVWDSVRVSVRAYVGSLFPGITTWRYVKHEPGVYPFQAAADLWRAGLVPSFDGKPWRLHGKAGVLWEGTLR